MVKLNRYGDVTLAGFRRSTSSFNITVKATSSVTINCPPGVTYNGSALEPCTATVTGAGGLSQSLGQQGFGTEYRVRAESGQLEGDFLPVDLLPEISILEPADK